ncbi:MAG: flagellar basal body-associated FliL family protein [Bacillota bacterium]|jgi:flagellar FliL protein|nr:flagellar basal body-associated FliL family protein [Clostridia bacterium]
MKKTGKFLAIAGVFILGVICGAGLISSKVIPFPWGEQTAGHVENNPNVTGPLIGLGEFTVNLNGGGALKTEITLEGYDKNSLRIIQEKQAFLTDRTITVLSSQGIAQVSRAEGREEIRSALLKGLNETCNNQIKDVLFTSFIYSFY